MSVSVMLSFLVGMSACAIANTTGSVPMAIAGAAIMVCAELEAIRNTERKP